MHSVFGKTPKIDILLNVTFLFIPSISHNFQSKSLMKYAVLSVFFSTDLIESLIV
jgi:hypothetical protein